METKDRNPKYLTLFAMIYTAVLVITPAAASKFVSIGGLNLNGATLIFPISFIFNDIFTEVYGYRASRRIIWTGMACQLLAALTFWLVGELPAASFWSNQEAYMTILGQAPRIAIASLCAYFFGEFANSVILSKMKYGQKGERGGRQAWRFVASTIVGEFFDSAVFMVVGFAGVLSSGDIIKTILTIWLVKVAYETIALPVSLPLANWVKRVEGVDQIDRPEETNYNPFGASKTSAK